MFAELKKVSKVTVLLRISGIIKDSIVDGPGLRLVLFTQGCTHNCLGCHNPQTHDLNGGYDIEINELNELLTEQKLIRGVTLSGGEPFLQAESLVPFAKVTKERGLNLIAYTGYYFEELLNLSKTNQYIIELLKYIDVLIDGPFELDKKDLSLPFRGSRNQRLVDVKQSLSIGEAIILQKI